MYKLTPSSYIMETGVIFAVIALIHLWRLISGWTVVINGWTAPTWVSVVAVIVAGAFAAKAYMLSKKK